MEWRSENATMREGLFGEASPSPSPPWNVGIVLWTLEEEEDVRVDDRGDGGGMK